LDNLKQVILHLGAHKTASTHFGGVIHSNNDLRKSCGVAAPRKGVLRAELVQRISNIKDDKPVPAEISRQARGLAGKWSRLLVMDENILGTPSRLFQNGAMYPRAARRVGRAAQMFEGLDVTLMMAIRNPATFSVASWSEALRSNPYRPFEAYLEGAQASDISWLTVITAIREAAPQAALVVWRYEDYRVLLPQLVACALHQPRDAVLEFKTLQSPVRVGLSARALTEICKRNHNSNAAPDPAEVEAIMADYPKSTAFPAPMPWSDADQKILDARYRRDFEALSQVEGITLLDAGSR
jgi:hypothetical protein